MSTYPLTTNHFQIEWGDSMIEFTEITGLSNGLEPIEHREGSSRGYSPEKISGQEKLQNIILKRAIISGDNEFYEWFNTINHNTIERRNLTILLLDEHHAPIVTWKILKAFPVRIEWSDLRADANEVAIESMELAHEGLVVQHE
jgi:phage tail-like protein